MELSNFLIWKHTWIVQFCVTFDRFCKKGADTIVNFNPNEGDVLSFSEEVLPNTSKADELTLGVAQNRKELKVLSEHDHDLLYLEKKGYLYTDGNDALAGWGNKREGGLIAILKGEPELTPDDIQISI